MPQVVICKQTIVKIPDPQLIQIIHLMNYSKLESHIFDSTSRSDYSVLAAAAV